MIYAEERKQVAAFMRRMYRQKLTTTSGGNISWRVNAQHVLLTASQRDKGCLRGDDVAVLSMTGENLTPGLTASIESEMHLTIYRRHSACQAVVHAHPVTASAFAASQVEINCQLVAESYAIIGKVVRAGYALMGTTALAESVAAAATTGPCVLMENHGVLTVGQSLLEAFDRLEVLEAAAQLTILTQLLGGGSCLQGAQLVALDQLMGR